MKRTNKFFAMMITFIVIGFFGQPLMARTIYVKKTPPARKVVVIKSSKPYHNALWAKGHWGWKDKNYTWVSGKWKQPRAGFIWIDGHWKKTRHGWVWVDGHWKKR